MINRIAIIATVLLASAPVLAQQQEKQEYVPITIEQADFEKLVAFLNEQPFKISAPILNALGQLEQKAVDAKKSAEPKKP